MQDVKYSKLFLVLNYKTQWANNIITILHRFMNILYFINTSKKNKIIELF